MLRSGKPDLSGEGKAPSTTALTPSGRFAATSPASGEGTSADVDWAEIRRAYEETSEPVAAIARRFGLTQMKLRYRREKEGWTTRPIGGRDVKIVLGRWAAEQLRQLLSVHGMLTGRLAATVTAADDLKIEHVEALLMQAKSRRALIRPQGGKMRKRRKSIEKLRKPGGTEKKNNNADGSDDLAWMRAELTRRLAGLKRGGTQGGS